MHKLGRGFVPLLNKPWGRWTKKKTRLLEQKKFGNKLSSHKDFSILQLDRRHIILLHIHLGSHWKSHVLLYRHFFSRYFIFVVAIKLLLLFSFLGSS